MSTVLPSLLVAPARRFRTAAIATTLALALTACGGSSGPTEQVYPRTSGGQVIEGPRETIWGNNSFLLFGDQSGGEDGQAGGGIGVNSFLWRASLDTVGFMPMASADPFGGVILTDWYTPPDSPDERFKIDIYILDSELRADGVRVSLFRQVRDEIGDWRNAEVSEASELELENAILTRARQMRMAQAN